MKRLGLLIAGLALLVTGMTTAFAAPLKIGVLDVRQIIQTSPQVKAIGQQLESKFKSRKEGILNDQNALEKQVADLQRDSSVMT